MSNNASLPTEFARRCPHCDSVVTDAATRCAICGGKLEGKPELAFAPVIEFTPVEEAMVETTAVEEGAVDEAVIEEVVAAAMDPDPQPQATAISDPPKSWRPSAVFILTAVFIVFMCIISSLILRYQEPVHDLGLFPTLTPIPPTITFTPTWTTVPSQTPPPTAVPTTTPTPLPTPTLQPPRPHQVSGGETMIGLASRYRVSIDSITGLNQLGDGTQIQVGQQLQIPWPTATPPLTQVGIDINGELVIADPAGCQRYEVQSGDSLVGIAARYDVNFDLLMQVNRFPSDMLLQPGDTVCIPTIVYGETLPPTPGPSPTPLPTAPPAGPELLFPVLETAVSPPDGRVMLQWVAVQDLAESEWYMVEMADLDEIDRLPRRGFTRDNNYQLPTSWRPAVDESHRIQWQVSIVTVTDWRDDGLPIYSYGGETSAPSFLNWLGAVPTATPPPTPTATATPSE